MKIGLNDVNYDENKTMELVAKQGCVMADTQEGNALCDILNTFGIEDINVLTKGEIIWLCEHIMSIGKVYGIRQERNRRNKG